MRRPLRSTICFPAVPHEPCIVKDAPMVLKLGGSHAASPLLRAWLDAASAAAGRLVLVPGGGPFADTVRTAQTAMDFDNAAAHDMALLAMAQYGRALIALCPACIAADSHAAILDALAARHVPVWMPAVMLRGAPDVAESWDVTSDSLALWLAARLGARGVVLVKACAARPDAGISALIADGVLDQAFPAFRAQFTGDVYLAGPNDAATAASLLREGRLPGRRLAA